MASIDPDPAFRCPGRRRCRIATTRRLAGLLWLGVAFNAVAAERYDVRVVADLDLAPQKELLASVRNAVRHSPGARIDLRVQTPAEFARFAAGADPAPRLVVTVGVGAGEAVLRTRPPVPVLCAFLPHSAFAALRERLPVRDESTPLSALYVDQPPERQMRLLRLALPSAQQIGVVLGPDSQRDEAPLRGAAADAGLRLASERIREERDLVDAVRRVLEHADALLAVPDPLVFNRHTAQNVLLTAYRRGKPVMGYSGAYVGAGALLAVFSTPEQIGRQLGEMLVALATDGQALPAPRYPRYFSVEVNGRVARSLGLRPPPAAWLAQRLTEAEDSGR